MPVSRTLTYLEVQQARASLTRRLGIARPDHLWVEGRSGCERCPASSPFRWEPGNHLYVIEEEELS